MHPMFIAALFTVAKIWKQSKCPCLFLGNLLLFCTKYPSPPPCSQWICEFLIFAYRHFWKIKCFRLSGAVRLIFSVFQVPLWHNFGQLNVKSGGGIFHERFKKKENSAHIASLENSAHISLPVIQLMPQAKGWPSRIRVLFLFIRKPSHKSFTAISTL